MSRGILFGFAIARNRRTSRNRVCKDQKVLDTQRLQKIMVITRTWIRVTKRIWMVMMLTVILDPKITTRIKMILIVTRIWMTKTTTMNLEEPFFSMIFVLSFLGFTM